MMAEERERIPVPRPDAGDIHFAAPWEATAFAMTVNLSEAGMFTWNEWVETFSSRIAAHPGAEYYRVWLSALEDILRRRDLVGQEELTTKLRQLIDNPPPHDHVARREPIAVA